MSGRGQPHPHQCECPGEVKASVPNPPIPVEHHQALGHRSVARAIGPLLPFQTHPNADVRYGVVSGMLGHTDSRAVACLITLSADPEIRVRDWATFGLAVQIDTDTPEIRAALLARLHDSDGDTAGEAMVGLARRKDAQVIAPLLELLQVITLSANEL